MIKRASSSEIFDIYTKKMISKRSSAAGAFEGILRFVDDLSESAMKIGGSQIDDAVLNSVTAAGRLRPELQSGIKLISKIDESRAILKVERLAQSAHIAEGAEDILRAANRSGYTESDVVRFLEKYTTDLRKMSSEYEALTSGTPTDEQVIRFVTENEKAIKFFNETQGPKMQRVLSDEFAEAGKRAAMSGKREVSMAEAGLASGGATRPRTGDPSDTPARRPSGDTSDPPSTGRPKTQAEIDAELERYRANTEKIKTDTAKVNADADATAASSKMKGYVGMAALGGSLLAGAIQLGIFGGIGAAGLGLWNKISGKIAAASGESEEHFQKLKDAIACIDAIDLEPGSPAVEQRENIKNNLNAVLLIEEIGNNPDRAQSKEFFDNGIAAGKALMGDGEGSISLFVKTISEHPMDNLEGFFKGNKYTSTASGVVGGAASGFMMSKTLIGGVIGAAVGGLAGYRFLGDWYDDEMTCVLKAGDAIKQIDNAFSKYLGINQDGSPIDGGTIADRGSAVETPRQTREDAGGSADDISFLERVLAAGATQKLIGIPGIELTNEVKLTQAYNMACGGIRNAAEIILMKNPNIKSWIQYIRENDPGILTAPVDSSLSGNKSAKSFLQSLYLTLQATFKNAVRGNRGFLGLTPNTEKLSQLIRSQLAKEGITITAKNNLNKMKKTSKSINNQELIRKAAETRVSYFGDANLGLKEQLTKSYYAGLTDMYNEKPQKRSSDYKDLYGFQEETGEDLVLQSHPKSVTLADAMGKGGLVENGLEAKEKSTYVALNTPSGNFQSKYASTIVYLKKLAKAADDQGKKEVSKLINQTIQKLK